MDSSARGAKKPPIGTRLGTAVFLRLGALVFGLCDVSSRGRFEVNSVAKAGVSHTSHTLSELFWPALRNVQVAHCHCEESFPKSIIPWDTCCSFNVCKLSTGFVHLGSKNKSRDVPGCNTMACVFRRHRTTSTARAVSSSNPLARKVPSSDRTRISIVVYFRWRLYISLAKRVMICCFCWSAKLGSTASTPAMREMRLAQVSFNPPIPRTHGRSSYHAAGRPQAFSSFT